MIFCGEQPRPTIRNPHTLTLFDHNDWVLQKNCNFFFLNLRRTTTMGKLTIFLDKVTNLDNDDDGDAGNNSKRDTFVVLRLAHDGELLEKKHKSSKKGNAVNPVYGETFCFEDLPDDGLAKYDLKVLVKDDDPAVDEKLGFCKIHLHKLDLTNEPKEVKKKIDRRDVGVGKDAHVYLKLSFETTS